MSAEKKSRKIRVLHIITRLIKGGAQINTLCTVTGLDKSRYDVTLVSGKSIGPEGEMESEARKMGVNLIIVPELVREICPVLDLKALLKLYRLIKKGTYDIVHTHTSKAGILGRMAAKLAGNVIIVHTPHGSNYIPNTEIPSVSNKLVNRTLFLWLDKFAAMISDKIIALTDSEVEHYMEIGLIRKKSDAVTIHSGIDLREFTEVKADKCKLKAQLGLPNDSKIITTVARLTGEKGYKYLIDAAQEVLCRVVNAKFLFVGDGILRDELEEEARRLHVEQDIMFLGLRHDVSRLLSVSDLFVLPSLYEGQGRVLVEAMAAGLPVVATKVGGVPDVVVDGETGILVPAADSRALAMAIIRILTDEDKAKRMGQAGRERVDPEFSVETMVEKIDMLYRSLKRYGKCLDAI